MIRKAFTLIELLVVIAIIAILAAILFPVFAQAKAAAKKTQDLSNMKQLGTSTQLYIQDTDDVYGQAYWYKDDAGEPGGYVHWSSTHFAYHKNVQMWVSPGDPNNGIAPTLTPCANISETVVRSPGCDSQVPRISYTVNAALMPRKRRTIDPANVVSATAIDSVASTILIAGFSNSTACVNDDSNQTVTAIRNKSHRPTNAVMASLAGAKWSGDNAADAAIAAVFAVTPQVALAAWDACKVAPSANFVHLKYIEPNRFGKGGNFAFADGHAKFSDSAATLNPNQFMWGLKMYSMGGKPILDTAGVNVR